MKTIDGKLSTYIDFSKGINDEGSKFKIGDMIRISKHKNILAKVYVPNWFEIVSVIKKV